MFFIIICRNCSLVACLLSPTKITLIGAVLFALQQTHYLPVQKHHLMLIYTVFTVVNKVSLVYFITEPVTLRTYTPKMVVIQMRNRRRVVHLIAYR